MNAVSRHNARFFSSHYGKKEVIGKKEIENLPYSSPREFWKLFKKTTKNTSGDIALNAFLKHFTKLHKLGTDVFHTEQLCEFTDFHRNECIYEELNQRKTAVEIKKVILST